MYSVWGVRPAPHNTQAGGRGGWRHTPMALASIFGFFIGGGGGQKRGDSRLHGAHVVDSDVVRLCPVDKPSEWMRRGKEERTPQSMVHATSLSLQHAMRAVVDPAFPGDKQSATQALSRCMSLIGGIRDRALDKNDVTFGVPVAHMPALRYLSVRLLHAMFATDEQVITDHATLSAFTLFEVLRTEHHYADFRTEVWKYYTQANAGLKELHGTECRDFHRDVYGAVVTKRRTLRSAFGSTLAMLWTRLLVAQIENGDFQAVVTTIDHIASTPPHARAAAFAFIPRAFIVEAARRYKRWDTLCFLICVFYSSSAAAAVIRASLQVDAAAMSPVTTYQEFEATLGGVVGTFNTSKSMEEKALGRYLLLLIDDATKTRPFLWSPSSHISDGDDGGSVLFRAVVAGRIDHACWLAAFTPQLLSRLSCCGANIFQALLAYSSVGDLFRYTGRDAGVAIEYFSLIVDTWWAPSAAPDPSVVTGMRTIMADPERTSLLESAAGMAFVYLLGRIAIHANGGFAWTIRKSIESIGPELRMWPVHYALYAASTFGAVPTIGTVRMPASVAPLAAGRFERSVGDARSRVLASAGASAAATPGGTKITTPLRPSFVKIDMWKCAVNFRACSASASGRADALVAETIGIDEPSPGDFTNRVALEAEHDDMWTDMIDSVYGGAGKDSDDPTSALLFGIFEARETRLSAPTFEAAAAASAAVAASSGSSAQRQGAVAAIDERDRYAL